MKNAKGFTLIELMIVIAILGIILAIAIPAFTGTKKQSKISYDWNGITEVRCIDNYKFIVTEKETRQIMDSFGKGVECDEETQEENTSP